MALACTGIVVSCRDNLPQYTCDRCLGKLDIAYACWKRCRQSWGNYKRLPAYDAEAEDFRCRICLKEEVEELISLYCICDGHSMKISDIIRRFSGLDVSDNDKFPQYICDVCLGELSSGYSFRKLAKKSNATLRPNAIKHQNEKTVRTQTNSSRGGGNLSLHEFLNFGDSSELTSPNDPEQSSAGKGAKQIRKPNVSTKKERQMKSPTTTLTPGKQIGQPVIKKVPPQYPVYRIPKEATLPLQSSTTTSKKVSAQSSTVSPPNLKKASFSNPTEFKKLTSKILKKSDQKSEPSDDSKGLAILGAHDIKIMEQMPRFTRSQITAFVCQNCENVCVAGAIQNVCIKCKLRFENYLPVELERKTAKRGYIEAYCCRDCSYFSVTLDQMVKHLINHNQKVDKRTTAPSASIKAANSNPIKPRTQSSEPVSNKRGSKEQTTPPPAKKQRSEEQRPQSGSKIPRKAPGHNWIRVEPSRKVKAVEVVDTDDESDIDGPELEAELQEADVLLTEVKLEDDPLDMIDPADSVGTCLLSKKQTNSDQCESFDMSSNDDFIGFEEEYLDTP